MRVSGFHNNLERIRVGKNVFRRQVAVGFQFICNESDAHSEAVDKIQGLHHAGDKRIPVVRLSGEILWPGLAVEVAGIVEFYAVGILVNVCRRVTSVVGSVLTDVHEELARGFVGIADEVGVTEAGDEFRALALQGEFCKLFQVLQFREQVPFEQALVEDFGASG